MFVITLGGNSDGYGEPIAVAPNRAQVESFITSHARPRLAKGEHEFDEIRLSGRTKEPFGWRKEAFCVMAEGYKDGERIIGTSYEVFKVRDASDDGAFDAVDFFGE